MFSFIICIPQIISKKDLSPFDRTVGTIVKKLKINFFGKKVNFPVNEIENISYTYGLIREMVFRKCYFQFISKENLSSMKTVIDLGANRGAFSTLMTPFAERIIAVECNEKYQSSFKLLMKENNFTNYTLVNKFISGKDQGANYLSFDDLLQKNNIESVDFLKIDIEGSEFGLFDQ